MLMNCSKNWVISLKCLVIGTALAQLAQGHDVFLRPAAYHVNPGKEVDVIVFDGDFEESVYAITTGSVDHLQKSNSNGIQIGGISAIAPSRKSDLAKVGLKAMFGGAIASWLTATIAGIFI